MPEHTALRGRMVAPFRWMASRLRNRPDSEHEMSFNRLVFAFIIVIVLLLNRRSGEGRQRAARDGAVHPAGARRARPHHGVARRVARAADLRAAARLRLPVLAAPSGWRDRRAVLPDLSLGDLRQRLSLRPCLAVHRHTCRHLVLRRGRLDDAVLARAVASFARAAGRPRHPAGLCRNADPQAVGGDQGGRGGEPGQEPVPGECQPRTAHAADGHRRHDRPAARHAAGDRPARNGRDGGCRHPFAALAHRRPAGSLAHRGRPHAGAERAVRPDRAASGCATSGRRARRANAG